MEQGILVDLRQTDIEIGEIIFAFYGEATKNHTLPLELYTKSLDGFQKAFTRLNKDLLDIGFQLEIVAEETGCLKARIKTCASKIYKQKDDIAIILACLSFLGINGDNIFGAVIDAYKVVKGGLEIIEKVVTKDRETQEKVYSTISKYEFRAALDDMTYALETEGIDRIEITQDGDTVTIHNYERSYFKIQQEDHIEVETYTATLSLIGVANDEVWRFSYAKSTKSFHAKVLDESFLEYTRSHNVNEAFKSTISAEIVKTTVTVAGNKKPSMPTYTINKVVLLPEQGVLEED